VPRGGASATPVAYARDQLASPAVRFYISRPFSISGLARFAILDGMDEKPLKPVPLWAKVVLALFVLAALAWFAVMAVAVAKHGTWYQVEVIETSEKKWQWP
jgi:hypothetical protein